MSFQSDEHTDWSASATANGRMRTGSGASGQTPKTPETGNRGVPASLHTVHSTNLSRPGTSPGLPVDSTQAAPPRLSLEAPSPSLGELLTESPVAVRHASTSSFYTAAPGPSQSQPQFPTQVVALSFHQLSLWKEARAKQICRPETNLFCSQPLVCTSSILTVRDSKAVSAISLMWLGKSSTSLLRVGSCGWQSIKTTRLVSMAGSGTNILPNWHHERACQVAPVT